MSRWGGIKKGKAKYASNWNQMKTTEADLKGVTSFVQNAVNFDYTTVKSTAMAVAV
jgi:hypothetical protein